MLPIPDKDEVKKGHNHLVGNDFCWAGVFLSNNGGVWTYGPDTADFLVNLNAKASGGYSWRCNRLADDPNKIGYAFAHRTCTGAVATGKQLCPKCLSKQYQLYEMCPSLLMTDFVLMCKRIFQRVGCSCLLDLVLCCIQHGTRNVINCLRVYIVRGFHGFSRISSIR